MHDFAISYGLLDEAAKREVADFAEFLLEHKGRQKQPDFAMYRQKLLDISTWSDTDIQPITEARASFNQWEPRGW